MQLTKQAAKKLLEGNFVPSGESVDIDTLNFRRTTESEVFQCCQHTGRDPQSGPFYCGDIAELVAFVEKGYVGICEQHGKGCSRHIKCAQL